MEIKQFYDVNLAHASYAVLSEKEIALIDPSRDPKQYYDFAKEKSAEIKAVIETHPHADFVSSHLEISRSTGAKIYTSKLVNPFYEYVPFDEGNELRIGNIKLIPINTPGHSPDSICILVKDESGNDYAVATGDTLFVGDVGRPDLRESAGSIRSNKEDLARMMYSTITNKLINLPDSVIVYPAHGAGSLCGKSTSTDNYSTIGKEKKENYALQKMSEKKFIEELLKDQTYIPKYFGYDVDLNRKGAPDFDESVKKVRRINSYSEIKKNTLVVDARNKEDFVSGHFEGAVNILEDKTFETWLGTVISPDEKFYLIGDSDESVDRLIRRAAKIGYELKIEGALVHHENSGLIKSDKLDLEYFRDHMSDFTIIDVRNKTEIIKKKIFENSISIPLNELRDRLDEIPLDKPILVHCAAGSRSAAASSILEKLAAPQILDLSENVKLFSEN